MVSNGSPTKEEIKTKQEALNWNELKARSLHRGGFGNERVDIWPRLLHAPKHNPLTEEEGRKVDPNEEKTPHSDERQISLDTDRSFVLYPAEPKIDRETLQAGLHQLLVSLFRKRPRLSYFQGYHDIATVFFLTLPKEHQLTCLEKVSLHRLRDSMGVGLEPILGLLRVTKNLLRLADPDYAGILEQSSPLPFYALSNLLTLFSHDMPTLPLIQHVFDYLLCRPPIASVYLAAAIIISRKQEVLRLQEEDEDGMIHSLLSSLPHLVDNPADREENETMSGLWKTEEAVSNEDSLFFKAEDEACTVDIAAAEHVKLEDEEQEANLAETEYEPSENPQPAIDDVDCPPLRDSAIDIDKVSPASKVVPSEPAIIPVDNAEEQDPTLHSTHSEVISNVVSQAITDDTKLEKSGASSQPVSAHPELTLVELLKRADDLYEKFPPSHSELALSAIMGPQSVIFTWSESPSGLPSDHTAEAMVAHPELVVYPYVEVDQDQKEELSSSEKPDKRSSKARRKRRKLRKSPFGHMEKKTVLAGTVIVLGVAMAVYGIKARHPAVGHGLFCYADGHGHMGTKDWKRVGGWLGGALAGMSQKILNGISSGA